MHIISEKKLKFGCQLTDCVYVSVNTHKISVDNLNVPFLAFDERMSPITANIDIASNLLTHKRFCLLFNNSLFEEQRRIQRWHEIYFLFSFFHSTYNKQDEIFSNSENNRVQCRHLIWSRFHSK